jgi:hypothetical protein
MFDRVVDKHGADKHDKKFCAWDQLLAMLFGQLSGASSLRQIEAGFNSQGLHHYHLGTREVRRSTLADANNKRKVQVFEEAARVLMQRASAGLRAQASECLYLLDSTSFTLKGRGFDVWTADTRTCHTQGLKLHMLYDCARQLPLHQCMSAPNLNDIDAARELSLEAGAMYVFDKGYCDYNWWAKIDAQGARFVTRFKRNAALRTEQTRPIPADDGAVILSDEIVRFANPCPGAKRRNHYQKALRRVVVARPGHEQPLVLATNDLDSRATTIAQHYKQRWHIELFFKWIKQHLKIKRFLGRSENAVRIQILCALIAYLLLALYRQAHGLKQTLWQLLGELRSTLFQRPAIEAALARRRRQQQAELLRLQPQLPL